MGHSPGEAKDKKAAKALYRKLAKNVFFLIYEVVEIECRLFIVRGMGAERAKSGRLSSFVSSKGGWRFSSTM